MSPLKMTEMFQRTKKTDLARKHIEKQYTAFLSKKFTKTYQHECNCLKLVGLPMFVWVNNN